MTQGKTYHPKSVAIDLDGTLAQYDGWKGIEHVGEPHKGARQFTEALRNAGCYIIIHTARTCTANSDNGKAGDVVRNWLECHGSCFDVVWTGVGKPIACAYVDDRAVACAPDFLGGEAYPAALEMVKRLAAGEK